MKQFEVMKGKVFKHMEIGSNSNGLSILTELLHTEHQFSGLTIPSYVLSSIITKTPKSKSIKKLTLTIGPSTPSF
jgi:hypothetical protein